MIKFSLSCDKSHNFDGWFRSNSDFAEQVDRNIVACPICNSTNVLKALMTPSVPVRQNSRSQLPVGPKSDPASSAKLDEKNVVPVSSAPSAPAAMNEALANLPTETREKVFKAMRIWRNNVVATGDDVGKNFAEEARKIHFKEKKERPIYGEATANEVEELLDDGIACAPLPILPEDHN